MAGDPAGWFARVDHECKEREQQIRIWIDAWEKSVLENSPITATLPTNWPTLPVGLLSDLGMVLDQLLCRYEADKDGRSVKGAYSIPAKFVDIVLSDEFKNTNNIKKKEPLATISLAALPPGFRAYAEQMNKAVKEESDFSSDYENESDKTKTGIPLPFSDLAVSGGILPDRMLRIHAERCNDLELYQKKEDTTRLLEGLQLLDSSELAVYATRRRLLIVLIKLGLVGSEEGKISRLDAELILENNVRCSDPLQDEWPWNEKPKLLVSKPPWLRIKDKFRKKSNGSDLRKQLSDDLRNITGSDGELRFSTLKGNVNLYRLYLERALQIVQKDGKIRMIVPDSLLREKSSTPLRKLLVSNNQWESAWSFSDNQKIFPGASQGILVIGVIKGGETEVLTSFGPLEIEDVSTKNGLSSKAPFLELERGPWSTWTDASWAVPKMPRDPNERKRVLEAIDELADKPRLSEDNWLNGGGESIRVRVGEIDQGDDDISNWTLESKGIPLIRGVHFELDDDKVILNHPAYNIEIPENSIQRMGSLWSGEKIPVKGRRIACQAVINSNLKRRLLWCVVPENCVLSSSVNYLQLLKETCETLKEEFGNLEYGLNTLVEQLNSDVVNIWSKVWAANNNINNYEIASLPFPIPFNASSLSFKGNKTEI